MLPAAPLAAWLAVSGRVVMQTAMGPLLKLVNRDQGSLAVAGAFSFVGFVILIPLNIFLWLRTPGYFDGIMGYLPNCLITGFIFTLAVSGLNWAMRRGDINLLVPLTSLSIIFVYALDLVFGSVVFGWAPFLGIVLAMIGVVLLNVGSGDKLAQILNPLNVLKQPGAIGAIGFAIGVSFCRVIDHNAIFVEPKAPTLLYGALANATVVLFALLFLTLRRKLPSISKLYRERGKLAIGVGLIGITNYLCMLYTYKFFSASFLEPLAQLAVILNVFIGTVYFKEPLRWRWAAALLVIAGSLIVLFNSGKF